MIKNELAELHQRIEDLEADERKVMAVSFGSKDMLSGSMYAREAMPHITKGGCYALDALWDICGA